MLLHLCEMPRIGKSIVTEVDQYLSEAAGMGKGVLKFTKNEKQLLNEYKISFRRDKNILKLDSGNSFTAL